MQPVALVSGANRGIGKEIARQLREDNGFLVLAGARDPGQITEEEGIVPIALDVADDESVAAVGGRVEQDPGRLDVLINNAGIFGPYDSAATYDLYRAREVIETNLFGAWRLIQTFLPLLRKSEHPRIVNVSSGGGQLNEIGEYDPVREPGDQRMGGGGTAYRLSKAALKRPHLQHRRRRARDPRQLPLPRLGAHRHGRRARLEVGRGGRRYRGLARDPPR